MNDAKSLVSVIIPCFNSEQTVNASIESVYNQDYDSIELIVVDDGSTDNSARYIKRWENMFLKRRESSFKYVYQKNRGLGGAIDTGLKYVSGDYLTLLDSDDFYLPNSISLRAKFLDSHKDYSLVRSNGYIVSGENKWLFTYDKREKNDNLFESLMLGQTYNWAGSYMIRTSILFDFYKDKSIYPSRGGQNLQLMLPVSYKNKCGYIDKPLMEYRRLGSSLSHEPDQSKAESKAISNAADYLDIRKHMIAIIPFSEEERGKWLSEADTIYNNTLLQIGIEHKDKQLIKNAIASLKKAKRYTIEEKITYYAYKNKIINLILRIMRRVKISFERMKIIHNNQQH